MAKYRITAPDGGSYEVTAPDTASQDEVLAYAKANYKGSAKSATDWKDIIGKAAKESFTRPMAAAKDLGTNPQTMANAMPAVLGTAGGIAYPFGGGTAGTAVGQGLRYGANKLMGKPVPSFGQHTIELGTAALGDVLSGIAQEGYYGSQIGKAEQTAGLSNIEKEAPPSGMRTAVKYIQALKNKMNTTPLTIEEARSIKPALDTIQNKGWLKGTEYSADLYDVHNRIKTLVNTIPGRAEAAAGMARTMTIPNMGSKLWKAIPQPVKYGAGIGGGATGTVGIYQILKRLLGG